MLWWFGFSSGLSSSSSSSSSLRFEELGAFLCGERDLKAGDRNLEPRMTGPGMRPNNFFCGVLCIVVIIKKKAGRSEREEGDGAAKNITRTTLSTEGCLRLYAG